MNMVTIMIILSLLYSLTFDVEMGQCSAYLCMF
jgi:hypothetical protein